MKPRFNSLGSDSRRNPTTSIRITISMTFRFSLGPFRKWQESGKFPFVDHAFFNWLNRFERLKVLRQRITYSEVWMPIFFWEPESFFGVVEDLSEGRSEIACHPGRSDAQLRRISSLQKAREKELKLFSDRKLRRTISTLGIDLVRFSEI